MKIKYKEINHSETEDARIQSAARTLSVDAFLEPPISVELQPTAYCHRTCVFCSHIKRNQNGGLLSPGLIDQILEETESMGVRRIVFSGGGEPLTWPGIADAVGTAAKFCKVTLVSSGDHLWSAASDRLSDLAGSILGKLDSMLLNIPDVTDAGMQSQVTGGPSWVQAEKMLHELVKTRACHGGGRIFVVVVVNSKNFPCLPMIDRIFRDIGVDGVYYKQFKAFEGRNVSRLKIEAADMWKELEAKKKKQSEEAWSKDLQGFLQDLGHVDESSSTHCWVNRLGFAAIVDPTGNVFLCSPTVGQVDLRIGNVLEQRFSEIWNGERRKQVCAHLSETSARGDCPIECRYHAQNRYADELIAGSRQHGGVRG